MACVFDTETTGLIENHSVKLDKQPEVIEFACVWSDWDDLVNISDQFEFMCKPSRPLPEKTITTTGLTDADLVKRPPFQSFVAAVEGYLGKADIIVAHNLSYDMEIIDLEFERLNRKMAWPVTRVCTVEQTVHITGNRIKLGDLYKFLTGQEHKDAHRAMPDVLATLRCLREIRERGWL